MHKNNFPVRDDVVDVDYHRNPTRSEIDFGHGCMHYLTVPVADACRRGTRCLKAWFVHTDGLRYYR